MSNVIEVLKCRVAKNFSEIILLTSHDERYELPTCLDHLTGSTSPTRKM